MQNDILFDNIYIGHSVEDAEALQKETYDVKIVVEKDEEEKSKPKKEETAPKSPMDLKFMDDPVLYIKEKVQLFMEIAKRDPMEAARFVPEVAGGIAVVAVTILFFFGYLVGMIGGVAVPSKEQAKDKAQKAKESAVNVKDKAAEAISTGTEQVKDEVSKRTGRNAAQ